MKKTTKKRSYKNAVSIGIAAFASVALLSTGLAAFVLIRNAQAEVTGNIEVAAVSDASITLTAKLYNTDTDTAGIRLDADKSDKTGRVQSEKSGKGEKLTQKITGTVKVGENKTVSENVDLTYRVDILNESGKEANESFITDFITGERLSYIDGFEVGEVLSYTGTLEKATDSSFEFIIGFNWGAKYGNINPSKFFDSTEKNAIAGTYGSNVDGVDNSVTYGDGDTNVNGASIPDNVVQQELLDLQKALSGYSFKVTVSATNK